MSLFNAPAFSTAALLSGPLAGCYSPQPHPHPHPHQPPAACVPGSSPALTSPSSPAAAA
ncbi:unnamed protein product, partial [Protopolystoma xenopodis]